MEIVGHPYFLAASKAGISSLLVPKTSKWLSRVKHGLSARSAFKLDPNVVISMHKTEVLTSFAFEVIAVLLSPMVAVFIFDGAHLTVGTFRL